MSAMSPVSRCGRASTLRLGHRRAWFARLAQEEAEACGARRVIRRQAESRQTAARRSFFCCSASSLKFALSRHSCLHRTCPLLGDSGHHLFVGRMSAFAVAIGGKADMPLRGAYVRLLPKADMPMVVRRWPLLHKSANPLFCDRHHIRTGWLILFSLVGWGHEAGQRHHCAYELLKWELKRWPHSDREIPE